MKFYKMLKDTILFYSSDPNALPADSGKTFIPTVKHIFSLKRLNQASAIDLCLTTVDAQQT